MRHDVELAAAGRALAAGDNAEAARLLTGILRVAPRHADALQLLGLVAMRFGKPSDALALFDASLAEDRRAPAVHLGRARALRALARLPEAEEAARRALTLRAGFPEALELLATVRLERGDPAGAQELVTRVLAAEPARRGARVLLGECSEASGDLSSAEAAYAEVRRADPEHPGAREGLARIAAGRGDFSAALGLLGDLPGESAAVLRGRARRGTGDLAGALAALAGVRWPEGLLDRGDLRLASGDPEGAEADWKAALALAPVGPLRAAILGNLAVVAQRRGQVEVALERAAAALRAAPETAHAWWVFAECAASLDDPGAEHDDLVAAALARPGIDPLPLERAARRALERDPAVVAALRGAGRLPDSVLVRATLRAVLLRDPAWEALLRRERAALVAEVLAERPVSLELLVAIALQATYSEHAWPLTPGEDPAALEARIAADGGEAAVAARLALGPPGTDPRDPPAWLRPLLGAGGRSSALDDLLRAAVREPAEELDLAEAVATLRVPADATSARVQAQYEESPYPRLIGRHDKPAIPLAEAVRGLLPHVGALPSGAPRILIAGCGTGQQALAAASRYAGAEVLAVDLSRRSLGRAARLARERGLSNLTFAQADLLLLGDLPERYELIECGGVLHHLDDPMSGWRALRGLLAPGGLMKIALYSEAARGGVLAARARLDVERGEITLDRLRAGRDALMALPAEHPARSLVWSPDFPSLAGFRDLVFHVCERRFTIPQLRAAIEALDLRFLGFQHPNPVVSRWYAERWPEDRAQSDWDRWEALEAEHPEAFAAMYQLWCQDPREPG